jgi:D-alanine-D-alanine ligase
MRVGIIYNSIEEEQFDDKNDEIAHTEVMETAKSISAVLAKKGYAVEIVKLYNGIDSKVKKDFDFIFNLAEDTKGDIANESDVPEKLQRLGIPFSGSSKKVIETCASKTKTKRILIKNDILIPRYLFIKNANEIESITQDRLKKSNMQFPLIAKPDHIDGSIGINIDSVVNDIAQLKKAVSEIIKKMKMPALIEEYIDGREINVSIIGNGNELTVLPLSETVFEYAPGTPRIHTYDSKWIKESEWYDKSYGQCPMELNKHVRNTIEMISRKAYGLVGISDYGRIDFRLKDEKPFLIEINPNPSLSPTDSPIIRSAKACGMNYDELIYKIFSIALERVRTKSNGPRHDGHNRYPAVFV